MEVFKSNNVKEYFEAQGGVIVSHVLTCGKQYIAGRFSVDQNFADDKILFDITLNEGEFADNQIIKIICNHIQPDYKG